jgi:hypothetical protein
MFAGLLAEIRAYGEGIVVAEQIPTKLVPDVVKNSAMKVLHRLPAADDRELVGATMNLNEAQSRAVVSLPPGRAAIFTDGMDRPVLAQIPYGEDREVRDPAPLSVAVDASRSPACGVSCLAQPCTLREIGNAAQIVDGDPRLTLWIELLAVSHVAGLPRPVPLPGAMAEVVKLAARERECAVGQAVDRAVGSRSQLILPDYRPDDLSAHLAAAAVAVLAGQSLCSADSERRWQAGRYRYADVAEALESWRGSAESPHPMSGEWRERGLVLWGATIASQIESYLSRPGCRSPGRQMLYGQVGSESGEHQSRLLRAAGSLSGAPDPTIRIVEAAQFLSISDNWHRHVFRLAAETDTFINSGDADE